MNEQRAIAIKFACQVSGNSYDSIIKVPLHAKKEEIAADILKSLDFFWPIYETVNKRMEEAEAEVAKQKKEAAKLKLEAVPPVGHA